MGLLAATDEIVGTKCAADSPEMRSGLAGLTDERSGTAEERSGEEEKMGANAKQAGGNNPVKRIPDWGIKTDRLSPAL